MGRKAIEPGLLLIFRSFSSLEAVALLLVVISYQVWPGQIQGLSASRFVPDLLGSAFLFVYLSIPWLQRWLKQFYLPIAIGTAIFVPMLSSRLFLDTSIAESTVESLVLMAWQLIPLLFVPLIIIAWQYNFSAVIAFSVIPAISDISLAIRIAAGLKVEVFTILSVIIIRTACFLLVGYAITQLMHTQREQRRALLKANMKLAQYANTLEQLATSRERVRLARELHDTLAHTLSALSVNLEAMKMVLPEGQDELQGMLDQSLRITRKGLTNTRRSLRDLRSSDLEDLGLPLAIRNLAVTASQRADAALSLSIDDSIRNVEPAIEQNLYRIAQESLENVVHHAEASRINVVLQQEDSTLHFEVADDGKGFPQSQEINKDHYGLVGMQERATLAGGKLTITSTPGDGTTIRLIIPVNHDTHIDL